MSNNKQNVYIAGMGVITPLGDSVEKTVAAVNADISAYQLSEYFTDNQQPITTAIIPEEIFNSFENDIDEGDLYGEVYDHIIKMSIIALRETFSQADITKPVPLILSMPESNPSVETIPLNLLTKNILNQDDIPIDPTQIRSIATGRAGVIQSIELAQRYLYEMGQDYVVIGGADCYLEYPVLQYFDKEQRLNSTGSMDGFVPGEAAGFLLVTKQASAALNVDNKVISLNTPGIAQEAGHFKSEEIYRGDGLDKSFKNALLSNKFPITRVYSSMNGESFWAKENGVAMMRNKKHFHENVTTEHPADCYGDLGAATGSVLLALSASQLMKNKAENNHLVYTSSDNEWRASVVVSKINLPN
ncbi:MAG: hypothetical protein DIZ80_06910 [endosymbiont of Galathealinum brachiosum]|uniref:Beta-ketoacyl synthase N-terminal domain-containing protein n=1 Tax=endosymbiont of Galathealinum brachiosum TaxID=2200906 RepID=A0A370DG16_9GAMM|nr:MAG: hypothetical protein DIZ80_06910 [endosymbiont of Galathealinum brachiosum]